MNFGNFCDSHNLVQQVAPATSCDYSCVTIFEPQYIGGKGYWKIYFLNLILKVKYSNIKTLATHILRSQSFGYKNFV